MCVAEPRTKVSGQYIKPVVKEKSLVDILVTVVFNKVTLANGRLNKMFQYTEL